MLFYYNDNEVFMGNKRIDLLERIASFTKCEYLSDLKTAKERTAVIKAIKLIVAMEYSIKEWEMAISYIFEEEVSFESKEDIYKYIKRQSE